MESKKGKQPGVRRMVSKHAKAKCDKYGIKIQRYTKKLKYSKQSVPQLANIRVGYDLLENLAIVRFYIEKKYKIDSARIDMLLYLYPKRLFTWDDFFEISRPFTFGIARRMVNEGYFVEVIKHKKKKECMFRLSRTSNSIVENFYMYLSGERPIPEDAVKLVDKTSIQDKMKLNLINKLNSAGVPENKKGYYE